MTVVRARVSRSRLTPAPAGEVPQLPFLAPAKKAASRAGALRRHAGGVGRTAACRVADRRRPGRPRARAFAPSRPGRHGRWRPACSGDGEAPAHHRAPEGIHQWDKMRPLARELDGLRETIAGPLAAADPGTAVALMRLLLSLGEGVSERSDDGSGILDETFRQAGADLGRLWALLPARDPAALAGELLALLDTAGYGVTDRLLNAAGPALGPEGRSELRRQLQERLAALPSRGRDDHGGWHGRGMLSFWLRELADLEGDVGALIAAAEAGGRKTWPATSRSAGLLVNVPQGRWLDWIACRVSTRMRSSGSRTCASRRWTRSDAKGRRRRCARQRSNDGWMSLISGPTWAACRTSTMSTRSTARWRSASRLAGRTWKRRTHWCGTVTASLTDATMAGFARRRSGIRPRRHCCIGCWSRTCCSARRHRSISMPPAT